LLQVWGWEELVLLLYITYLFKYDYFWFVQVKKPLQGGRCDYAHAIKLTRLSQDHYTVTAKIIIVLPQQWKKWINYGSDYVELWTDASMLTCTFH
jgi:hypothetical protein